MASISIVAAVGAIVAGGVSAYESHEQGVAVKNADKQKARVEAMNETQKQIGMRQKMLAALSSQNASALGAVGTGANSGFGANVNRQITENQNDLATSAANSSAQVSLLDQAGANAEAAGNFGAASDALGGISKGAGIYASAKQ